MNGTYGTIVEDKATLPILTNKPGRPIGDIVVVYFSFLPKRNFF